MISCVNAFLLSLQCFSFKSCDMGLAQLCHHGVIVVTSPWHSCANAVLQLCQLRDRITSHSLQRMHQILVWW